jgi:UDP-glucuronate decarboxylase
MMDTGRDCTGPINIGNASEFTVRELADHVLRLVGGSSKLRFEPLPADDPRQRRPDIALARDKLGWAPTIGLEEGLGRTIDYFRSSLSA